MRRFTHRAKMMAQLLLLAAEAIPIAAAEAATEIAAAGAAMMPSAIELAMA